MYSWLPWLLLALADNETVEQNAPTAELPTAARCAAMFAITADALKSKSGDPAMTQGFVEDAAALRRIAAAERGGADAAADAAIAAERKRLRDAADGLDLKPCYRVKALGPAR